MAWTMGGLLLGSFLETNIDLNRGSFVGEVSLV